MNKNTLKRILSYTKPYKGQMIGAFLCALVQVLSLLIPVLIGYAIDNIIDVGNVHFAVIYKNTRFDWCLSLGPVRSVSMVYECIYPKGELLYSAGYPGKGF